MADNPTGTDWSEGELDLIVADYFRMLQAELAGENYSKAEHRGSLLALIKRSKGSVEFKHQNISAVLQDLSLPWITGYKPRSNYQGALLRTIERQLAAQPGLLEVTIVTAPPLGDRSSTGRCRDRASNDYCEKVLVEMGTRNAAAGAEGMRRDLEGGCHQGRHNGD